MSKKMCEICHKNSDEVPDREEIRPVIAAAPAMMEALVEVLEITESIPVCPFCQCYGAGFHWAGCTTERINAAIRKVRGEE